MEIQVFASLYAIETDPENGLVYNEFTHQKTQTIGLTVYTQILKRLILRKEILINYPVVDFLKVELKISCEFGFYRNLQYQFV